MTVDFTGVAFTVFGVPIYWYGIMYLVAISAGWWLGRYRIRKYPQWGWSAQQMDDLVFYAALGIILGGRIGYLLFYDLGRLLDEPTLFAMLKRIVAIRDGGMSFHGGLLGVMFACWLFARKQGWAYFKVMDFIAPLVPLGLGAGRIGNFINGELWGKPTDLPWGMIFKKANDGLLRHPNPLYEAFLEGLVLFVVLWWFSSRPRPRMAVAGMFAVLYSVFRFGIEFVRMPDAHLGYLAFDWLTMGHLLTLPLLALGIWLIWKAYSRPVYDTAGDPGDEKGGRNRGKGRGA
ncbi:MAG TPA: prolipoprotein diacylglyceryl transferase [Gammaproteobacteria bacterium]|nr:prolipoprotein diacylglyceryl transferase [Gammaproteobacteria bacterium]